MESDLLNQIGHFVVNALLLEESPYDVQLILEHCIVLRAEHNWATKRFEYIALHPDFDPVDRSEEIPRYEAVVSGGRRTWRRR